MDVKNKHNMREQWLYVSIVLLAVVLLCVLVPRQKEPVYLSTGSPLTVSDERFKEDIRDVPEEDVAKLMQVRVKTFKVVDDKPKVTKYGFIAQEAEQLYPNTIITFNGRKYMDYTQYTPLLVRSVQLMQADVQKVKAEMEELKKASPKGMAAKG